MSCFEWHYLSAEAHQLLCHYRVLPLTGVFATLGLGVLPLTGFFASLGLGVLPLTGFFATLGLGVLPLTGLFASLGLGVLSMMLFSGSFALMYAPLLERCVSTIPAEKSGTAIGFYNLTLKVAAKIDKYNFNIILFTLAAISALALVLYWLLMRKITPSV